MSGESVVGRNGIAVGDVGDCWRAFSGVTVSSPQILDYRARDNRTTGIKYALGVDDVSGRTRIAWVDYPKSMYTLEEIMDDDEVVHILTHCNVCNAVDQLANSSSALMSSSGPVVETRSRQHQPRVSLGDAIPSQNLPKYLTTGVKLGKSLMLRPVGNAAFSFALSLLADVASGFVSDPKYRTALQSFSDDLVDDLSPELLSAVKSDALRISEAIAQDSDSLMSRKFIAKHMFKSPTDIRNEISASENSQNMQSGAPRQMRVNQIQSSGRDNHLVYKLWE